MIRILTHAPQPDGGEVMCFKLTEPQDELEGEMGEFLSDKVVKLGLGGNVFKAMGYKYSGGTLTAEGVHTFWYKSVERDRFKDGPLYYELTFNEDKKLTQVRRLNPTLDGNQAVLALDSAGKE